MEDKALVEKMRDEKQAYVRGVMDCAQFMDSYLSVCVLRGCYAEGANLDALVNKVREAEMKVQGIKSKATRIHSRDFGVEYANMIFIDKEEAKARGITE